MMWRYILFIVFLFPSLCFAQGLQLKVSNDIYNNADLSMVIKPGQAFITFDYVPNGVLSNTTVYTYSDIKSGRSVLDWSYYPNTSSAGRSRRDSVNDITHVLSIIDSDYFYVSAINTSFRDNGIPQLNEQLANKGLGSPSARATYISSLNNSFDVVPVNFASYLGRWLLIGIAIAIAIPPLWWVVRRFLR